MALLEQILQKVVAVGVLVVHEFLPCGIGGVLLALLQYITGDFASRLMDPVRAIGIHLGQHGDIVILIGHTGKGEAGAGLGTGIGKCYAAQQQNGNEQRRQGTQMLFHFGFLLRYIIFFFR